LILGIWTAGSIYVLGAGLSLLIYPLRGWPAGIASIDFLDPLTAARILRGGSSCIYCPGAQHAVLSSYAGLNFPVATQSSFLDPPLAAFILKPLAGLEIHAALAVLLVLSLVSLLTAGWLLYRLVLPPGQDRWQRLVMAGAALLVLPSQSSVWVGQWDPFLLLAAVAGVLLMPRRSFTAGLVLSVLLLKPQLIWLLPIALLSARQWRTLAGMAAGGVVWAASTALILGPAHVWDWPSATGYSYAEGLGIPHLVVLITASKTAATVSVIVLALIVWALTERWSGRLRTDPRLAAGIGLAASLACSPHVYDYDLVLLALPLCIWARTRPLAALSAALSLRLLFVLADVVAWTTPLYVYAAWLAPVTIFAALSTVKRDTVAVQRA
jgi:Glycosyltransferase family 87